MRVLAGTESFDSFTDLLRPVREVFCMNTLSRKARMTI